MAQENPRENICKGETEMAVTTEKLIDLLNVDLETPKGTEL